MARPRSFDQDHVIHTAEREFRAKGYNGTSVDDISSATGLGRGSLYAAFGDKRGVLLQAMSGYFTRLEQIAMESLSGPDDGALERLRLFLLSAVEGVPLAHDVPAADDRATTACFAAKMALEFGTSDPDVEHRINASFAVLQASVAACVRAAQRNGDLDAQADPDDIAWLLLAVARGMDVVGATGLSPRRLTSIAESAFDGLLRQHSTRSSERPATTRPEPRSQQHVGT